MLNFVPTLALNVQTPNATPNATPNGNATQTIAEQSLEVAMRRPIVEALNVEALNGGTFNDRALDDGTFIDKTFNDRALDVYTLFLFQFIKNFASQVALGGSKFAYLCRHIT